MDRSHLQPQQQPSSGLLEVPSGSSPGASPSPSRRSSRISLNPPTPAASSEANNNDDYFERLSPVPSTRSRLSVFPSFRRSSVSEAAPERPVSAVSEASRVPSIRLRRVSNASLSSARNSQLSTSDGFSGDHDDFAGGRPRSISQPERARVAADPSALARHSRRVPQVAMPRLTEEGARPTMAELGVENDSPPLSPTLSLPENTTSRTEDLENNAATSRMGRARAISRMFWPGLRRQQQGNQETAPPPPNYEDEYTQELVDWLDVIDPEVQTLSTLTNVQNSLFVPDLGNWINRRPTYVLSQHDVEQQWARATAAEEKRQSVAQELPGTSTFEPPFPADAEEPSAPPIQRSSTITSRLTESHYAALPHGTNLEGWTPAEKRELDDHVRHLLHSRRARFKRRLKGFGQYVRRPLGFFVTLYATLITLFGLAWVLFLIGWIYVGSKQVYAIHVIDSVLVALFAVMGDGLAPFRAVDTYHMIYIARYSRMIANAKKGKRPRSRLQKRNIPPDVRESMERAASADGPQIACHVPTHNHHHPLQQPPNPRASTEQDDATLNPPTNDDDLDPFPDLESAKSECDFAYLTPRQQRSLEHHQRKLAKSHSFYKPHETFTHHAFPLDLLIAIVVLLDCHSCLQISLGACTWGIDYHTRPFALTTVILCVSITCNITAGLVITIGDRRTRKKDVMALLDRQELTGDAIRHIERRRREHGSDNEGESSSSPSPVDGDSTQEKDRNKLTKEPTLN